MINIDALLINADWPKRTLDTFAALQSVAKPVGLGGLTRKFDESLHPRDKDGRFAEATTPRVFNTPADVEDTGNTYRGEKQFQWVKERGHLLTGVPIARADIPDVLYHVTTNGPAVESSGVLLGQQKGAGLGGGQADGVSFTSSHEDAIVIQREVQRAVRIARGEDRQDAIERYAREDEVAAGLPKGSLQQAADYAMDAWPANAQSLTTTFVWDENLPEDQRGWVGPPPSPEEHERLYRGLMSDAIRAYLQLRERTAEKAAGHPVSILKNPLLMGDKDQLRLIDPTSVQILEVPSSQIPATALVTTGSDVFLHEVRVYADVPMRVRAKKFAGILKFDEAQHPRDTEGQFTAAGGVQSSAATDHLEAAKLHSKMMNARVETEKIRMRKEYPDLTPEDNLDAYMQKDPKFAALIEDFKESYRNLGNAERAADEEKELIGAGPAKRQYFASTHRAIDTSDAFFDAKEAHKLVLDKVMAVIKSRGEILGADGIDVAFTDPDYLASQAHLQAAHQTMKDAEALVNTHWVAMKVEVVSEQATAMALEMGIDPAIIHVVDKDPPDFMVGGRQFAEAGHFDPRDGQIELNTRNISYGEPDRVRGIASHEAFHAMFKTVNDALDLERFAITALPVEEKKRLFRVSDWGGGEFFIHGAKPEAIDELTARFPASAAFANTWGEQNLEVATDSRMSTGRDDSRRDAMIKENGHSGYAKAYWTKQAIQQRGGTYQSAVNETLAEVTRYLLNPKSWSEEGHPDPKSKWVELNIAIRKAHAILEARRKGLVL